MAKVSAAELQRLANETEEMAVRMADKYGGPYIEHVFEAAGDVAASHPSVDSFEQEKALAAAIMRVHGYEAKNPSGKKFGQSYDLPGFHGRGDQDFFF